MYSGLVEKKPLLCYPFEDYVPAFIQEVPSHCGRNVVSPGARYFAAPKIIGLPFTILYSLGKCRHWSGVFCVFHDSVYRHY